MLIKFGCVCFSHPYDAFILGEKLMKTMFIYNISLRIFLCEVSMTVMETIAVFQNLVSPAANIGSFLMTDLECSSSVVLNQGASENL